MGIIQSYLWGASNEPDPVTGLTPREKAIVVNTWSAVRKDFVGAGVQLFLLFVKDKPEYKNVFSFKDIPYDELANSVQLKAHSVNVMYAFTAIIDNLDNADIMINLLEKSAKSHAKRNIPPQAYWDLKRCTMELLQHQNGSKFTKECREAWDKTLTVAFTVVIKAIEKERSS